MMRYKYMFSQFLVRLWFGSLIGVTNSIYDGLVARQIMLRNYTLRLRSVLKPVDTNTSKVSRTKTTLLYIQELE